MPKKSLMAEALLSSNPLGQIGKHRERKIIAKSLGGLQKAAPLTARFRSAGFIERHTINISSSAPCA